MGCTKVEEKKDKKPDGAVTYDRKIGELTQELWTVMVVQHDSKNIKFIRFGAGEDMEL